MKITKSNGAVLTAAVFALGLGATLLMSQEKGGGDETGPYELVPNWPKNPCGEGYQVGSTSGIFAESPDRVFIFMRGCLPELTDGSYGEPQSLVPSRNASRWDLSRDPDQHPRWDHVLYIVNREGEMIESWEQHNHLFVRPHIVTINPYDPESHVWTVDDGAHQITKFTNDGKSIVMQLGEIIYRTFYTLRERSRFRRCRSPSTWRQRCRQSRARNRSGARNGPPRPL